MKGICISLFHGRNNPNEQLEDWGFDGAVIMNVGFAWTYGSLKIFEMYPDGNFGEMLMLPVYDGMVVLDNKFYGDFEICLPTDPIATNPDREKLTFFELKALIEKNNLIVPTDMRKEALKAVLDYSMPEERKSLVEHLYNEVDKEEDFENMADEDLYNYCAYNNVAHIWCFFYILSTETTPESKFKWTDEDIVRFGEEYLAAYNKEHVGSAIAFLDTFK